jgi:hypothetical protein
VESISVLYVAMHLLLVGRAADPSASLVLN